MLAACAVRTLAATSSLAVVSPMIRVIVNNPCACCVVVKEGEKIAQLQRLNNVWQTFDRVAAKVGGTVGRPKNAYFPLLIRMPQGAKLPIFLDYLYRRKNKLIKT